MAKYCLFDLDGTLTESGRGITGSVQYALRQFGVDVPNRDDLRFCVGPPIVDVFMERFGFDRPKAEAALTVYREHYGKYGLFDNAVYEGIPELLKTLKERGKVLAVATSKPTNYSEIILEHFGLLPYFDVVSGSTRVLYEKADVLRQALKMLGVSDLRDAVLVGDRKFDVIGAKKVGVSCIGVTYGYGSREELMEAGADHVVDLPMQVADYV